MKTLHLSIVVIFLMVLLFPCNKILAQNEILPTIEFDHAGYFTKTMNCDFYDTGKISVQDQEQTKATIIVTDPSANKFITSIDHVTVNIWSDSDKKGVEITALETEVNSGVFKGIVTISDGNSNQNTIHVSQGDTLSAKYTKTNPWSLDAANRGFMTTAFIGLSCPPIERVPASSIRVLDNTGNESNVIKVGQQVTITADITNPTITNQNFTYIVQIQDKNGTTASLAWLSGKIFPKQAFSPSISWTPSKEGSYTVNVFVWQSISNPNALSAPRSADVTVLHDFLDYKNSTIKHVENLHCKLGFELVIKSEDGSPACVKPDTASKLVERGWAKEIISNVSISETTVIIPENSSNTERGLIFTPSTVKVVIGVNNTVKWINKDDVVNDITSDTGDFETGVINVGHSWVHLFNKPGTYAYHSVYHPWLTGTVIVSPPTENTNFNTISENDCGQFYTVPQDSYSNGSETYPVLILKQNSIGCAKLTYSINYSYNDNRSGSVWSQMLNFTDMFHIGKYNYTTHGNSFGVSSIDTTMHTIKTKSIPDVVDLAKYPVGSQFTVTLMMQPMPNATGFYDYSIEEIPCDAYPLAVGYGPDQLNSSDFSKGMIGMHNHSCANMPYEISSVQVSGMNFKQIKFP